MNEEKFVTGTGGEGPEGFIKYEGEENWKKAGEFLGNIEKIVVYQCNEQLRQLLIALRDAQRQFFKAAHGSLARVEALKRSKALEKELDDFLSEQQPKPHPQQQNLFDP